MIIVGHRAGDYSLKNKFFTLLFAPFLQKSQQKFCLTELRSVSRPEQIEKGRIINMNSVREVQNNCLKVSEDVIYHIAEVASCDVDGVTGLSKSKVTFSHIFTKESHSSAVKIKMLGDVIEISVSIIVSFGCKVSRVAEAVQQKIKNDIQSMTGVTVARVNVTVDGG